MKYEIIISPENGQYCGKCTYKSQELSFYGSIFKCLLFDRSIGYPINGRLERCGDCKILTERFMKMPELDEG